MQFTVQQKCQFFPKNTLHIAHKIRNGMHEFTVGTEFVDHKVPISWIMVEIYYVMISVTSLHEWDISTDITQMEGSMKIRIHALFSTI